MNRNLRLILAFLVSSILALIIGLLSNAAANTLVTDNPKLIWTALVVTFVISLPITLYLFLHEEGQDRSTLGNKPEKSPQSLVLPTRPYQHFFGRDALLDKIMSVLREPDRKPIIGIDGMGGIGKTALAREVVERCLAENLFDTVIWEPKSSEIGLHTIKPLTWNFLMTVIGRQLGAPDIQSLPDVEKEARLTSLLQARKVLFVLDNLETVVRDQEELSEQLLPFFSHSRCLMTSRRRFRKNVYALNLKGLEQEDGVRLLRYEATERGIKRVAATESHDLRRIAQATGGSPLAMKLVVGQLQHLPLEVVLRSLQEVQLDGEATDESDYIRFYKSIFWNSWQLLNETAQRLLVSMAVFAPGIGGTLDAIQSTSNLEQTVLLSAVEDLWRFSFLEVGEKGLQNSRYYLHPLTQYFVVSDIVQSPSSS
jgi:hypothetical protein